MSAKNPKRRTWSNWMPLGIGIFSVIFLFGAVGGWSVSANISGAVIGKGKIQVTSNTQALQHPTGGVVAEVLVEDGDTVNAGDVVVRLDDTQLRTELKIVEGELYEILSAESRLEAEIDESSEMHLPALLTKAARKDPEIKRIVERQRRHLQSRLQGVVTKAGLLRQQIGQVEKQINGVEAELSSKSMRRRVIEKELNDAAPLAQKGLIKLSALRSLKKDQLTTLGEIGKLTAKVAELKGKISELELQLHALGPKNREEAIIELGKLRPLKTKFFEQRLGILGKLSNLEIRSPISGKIHDLQVQGLRSVVVAAKPLMFVIPDNKEISVAVKVDASDIDQVYQGQDASLKFKSFNRRRAPLILGTVTYVSADAFLEPTKNTLYYEVEISLSQDEVAKLESKQPLIPGMPVDAFIATESRSPLNYVTKPLIDYFDRAFRDS